ncbi:hypothetical protein C0991_011592 [Blastosporella zonata]|nr:hypothetical protein C0991_011592 [Blastosporella zonata]
MQRELRGGTKKWTLSHLPNGTSDNFTNLVLPRVRRINSCLAPWTTLLTQQLQDIVDDVFGEGAQHVSDDVNVWKGLTSYRLNNWRNGFITVACTIVKTLFFNIDDFPDEKAIKRAVKWYAHVHTLKTTAGKLKTAAYQWQQWEDNSRYKKGFTQCSLIIETLAEAHLDNIDVQPSKRDNIKELPVGALIHSLQAVEHALKEYKTGTCVINKTARGHYSADNYGDRKECKVDAQGSPLIKEDACASRYIRTIKAFQEKHWDIIFEEAGEHLLCLSPRCGKKLTSSSHSSSVPSVKAKQDIIFMSDASEDSEDKKGHGDDSYMDSKDVLVMPDILEDNTSRDQETAASWDLDLESSSDSNSSSDTDLEGSLPNTHEVDAGTSIPAAHTVPELGNQAEHSLHDFGNRLDLLLLCHL